jgi:hypothetical protein
MNTTCSLRVVSTLLVLTAVNALALSVPVAGDTYSTTTNLVSAATGAATSLAINAKQTAFVRFDLSDPRVVPPAITPGNLVSATLRLYVTKAIKPDVLIVHTVSTDWTETPVGRVAAPSVDVFTFTKAIPAGELLRRHFVNVDVTEAVKAALDTGGDDFGFAIGTVSPTAKIFIASKEGAAAGYAAELEIEANFAGTMAGENLRIVRGVVSGAAGILVGSGFTASKGAAGSGFYTITFTPAFSGPPTVTATADLDGRVISTVGVTQSVANFQVSIAGTGAHTDAAFHVIAIGPR